jgi:hypothetical protein
MLGKQAKAWASALLGPLDLSGWSLWRRRGQAPLLLSARDSADGGHLAVAYRLNGSEVFSTAVAQRCHAIVQHPRLPMALFVARRPGTESYLIDLRDGRLLQTLSSPADRHFYGHAVIHASGDWLYMTENDTRDPGRGVVSVYRLHGETWQRHAEHSSHGIGPHELAWLPDGETLVVANGGIRTEAESRVDMNLDAMQPSLVLMKRDGELISREILGQSMNSIRHLAVATDGTVLASQQFMGDAGELAELLAIKRPGQPFEAFPVAAEQLREMRHYTASVAVHSELRLVALTAPRANRVFIWELDSAALRLEASLADCAGVAAVAQGFVVSSGQGRCRLYDCRKEVPEGRPLALPAGLWDNHLHMA